MYMKIIEPSVDIIWPEYDILQHIENAGRIAYRSESKAGQSPEEFVGMLIRRGHESVLEHASASAVIVCDRGISHELVRHRLASYTQESTRYCKYEDGIRVLRPSGLPECLHLFWAGEMEQAEAAYRALLHWGVSAENARSVLPTALATKVIMTANMREWRHVMRLRTAPTSHPEMRWIANAIKKEFEKKVPVLVKDIE